LDIRHHTPAIQKRIDEVDVEEENQEIGAGLRYEEELGGSVTFQQERRRSQEPFEFRRRVRGRGDRRDRSGRQEDDTARIHFQS